MTKPQTWRLQWPKIDSLPFYHKKQGTEIATFDYEIMFNHTDANKNPL